jgi:hypothetical protein
VVERLPSEREEDRHLAYVAAPGIVARQVGFELAPFV